MLIDSTHRAWIIASAVVLAVAAAGYVPYALLSVQGPQGGSAVGLIFGSVGSALMLFAGLLGARKKYPVWRVGRATNWMRGHLWLGLLSFPLILFHAGFRLGSGSLTRALMVLFIFVVVSGIAGAALQHWLPRVITERVPLETVYEQIDHVRGQLLEEAAAAMNEVRAALEGDLAQTDQQRLIAGAAAGTMGGMTFASAIGADERVSATLSEFFRDQVRPFLEQGGARHCALANSEQAGGIFEQLRILVPKNLWPRLNDIESICEEKRQLDRQRIFHRVLHGWLLVHIPASYALLVLGVVHAVVALRY